jgi:hypothetical protein
LDITFECRVHFYERKIQNKGDNERYVYFKLNPFLLVMLSIKGLTLHENLLKFGKKQKITKKKEISSEKLKAIP